MTKNIFDFLECISQPTPLIMKNPMSFTVNTILVDRHSGVKNRILKKMLLLFNVHFEEHVKEEPNTVAGTEKCLHSTFGDTSASRTTTLETP